MQTDDKTIGYSIISANRMRFSRGNKNQLSNSLTKTAVNADLDRKRSFQHLKVHENSTDQIFKVSYTKTHNMLLLGPAQCNSYVI